MHEPPGKPPEFDAYAAQYTTLLHDPIREKFARENRFFVERKLQVIQRFFKQVKVDTRRLTWLDVGCGRGDLLRLGRSAFGSAMGCDVSAGMLEASRDLEVRQQSTVDRIPWTDQTFDFITAVCVFHHVRKPDRLALVREMLRVLKPGGCVCIIEHNPMNPVTRLVVSRSPVDADASLLTASRTRRLLGAAGARNCLTRYFLYLPELVHKRLAVIEDVFSRLPFGGQYAVFSRVAAKE